MKVDHVGGLVSLLVPLVITILAFFQVLIGVPPEPIDPNPAIAPINFVPLVGLVVVALIVLFWAVGADKDMEKDDKK